MRKSFLNLLLLAVPTVAVAQPESMRRYLFVLDLQGTALDEFPSAVKALNGVMTVVEKDGQHMLKASSPSEFLVTLPQPLPSDFTLELDLIPKRCCAPDDIMLEGMPSRNRGVASVELTWHPERISAVGGGGEMYQSDMPADLAASTPGNLTHVVVVFQGTQIKLYTNGRRLYTLDKQFARGRVLRVWLGGADDGLNAVHLAGFRIGGGAIVPNIVSENGPGTAPASDPSQPSKLTGNPLPVVTPSPPLPPPSPEPSPPPPPPPAPATVTGAVASPPMIGGTSLPMSLCAPPQTSPGPAPTGLATNQIASNFVMYTSLLGADLTWYAVPGAAGYVVERGPASGTAFTKIASTCDNPGAFQTYTASTGLQGINFRDRTGGIQLNTTYVYVVRALGSGGQAGWNSARWTSPPTRPLLIISQAQVTGSTIKLKWEVKSRLELTKDPATGTWYTPIISEPTDFLITSDYGFSQVKSRGSFTSCGCYIDILGVPLGSHLFTITARWPPDVSIVRSTPVTIAP